MIPRLIDTRFLTLHPVTAAWHARRDKCRQCKHHHQDDAKLYEHKAERCHAYKLTRTSRGRAPSFELCVDARATADERDDGLAGLCGPAAVLFEPKVKP